MNSTVKQKWSITFIYVLNKFQQVAPKMFGYLFRGNMYQIRMCRRLCAYICVCMCV